MNNTIFTLKPQKRTCDCIICRSTKAEASDEHIIPKALGGYMHTWNVCKACNSHLGDHVDSILTQHEFIAFQRHIHNLRGQSRRRAKTPLEGVFKTENGTKCKVEYRDGKFETHLLPTFVEGNGKITLSLDPKDINKADKIIQKYCTHRKYKIIPSEKEISEIKEMPSPSVSIRMSIDLIRFRLPIVKIAYEFTVSLLPDLISDPTMILVAEILHSADIERLNELVYIGDGFEDIAPHVWGDFIDFSNTKRHYIFLVNIDNGLYCCVKLFNTFFLGVKLSNKSDVSLPLPIIAVNDFGNNTVSIYNIEELVAATNSFKGIYYLFKGNTEESNKLPEPVLFAPNKEPLLFLTPQICIGTLPEVMALTPENNISTSIVKDVSITRYHFNGRVGFLNKENGLLLIDQVISRSQISKI